MMDDLVSDLVRDEDEVLKMYQDSKGIWTIGVGHNLVTRPISRAASRQILSDDIQTVFILLDKYCPWWRNMNDTRQRAFINMAFTLGVGPSPEDPDGELLGFVNTLTFMKNGDYQSAAKGMRQSLWHQQATERVERLAQLMEQG